MVAPRLLVPLVILGASGCMSVSTYKTARPVGAGATEILVAPEVAGSGPPGTEKAILPEIALGLRHGLGRETDVAVAGRVLPLGDLVTSWAVGVAGKRRLWSSASGRLELAVEPGLGYRRTTASGAGYEVVEAVVPVIAGINLSDSQLVVSPLAGWQRIYSPGAHPLDVPYAGASLGIELVMSSALRIRPELSWALSTTDSPNGEKLRLIHGGIGVAYRMD